MSENKTDQEKRIRIRQPLPEDCIPIGEFVNFNLLGKAQGIQRTVIDGQPRGYVVILCGLKWIQNAFELIDAMDRSSAQDIMVLFENKEYQGRQVRGMRITVVDVKIK